MAGQAGSKVGVKLNKFSEHYEGRVFPPELISQRTEAGHPVSGLGWGMTCSWSRMGQ